MEAKAKGGWNLYTSATFNQKYSQKTSNRRSSPLRMSFTQQKEEWPIDVSPPVSNDIISKTPSCDISRLFLCDITNMPPLWHSEAHGHELDSSLSAAEMTSGLCDIIGSASLPSSNQMSSCSARSLEDTHLLTITSCWQKINNFSSSKKQINQSCWSADFTTWTFSLLRHSGESSSASDRSAG